MVCHQAWNQSVSLTHREKRLEDFQSQGVGNGILLATCDRVEFFQGYGSVSEETVRHLFRLTAGLESPLLGENAIQGQVKQAYLRACENREIGPSLHRLFQTALRVGKRVRRETTIGKGAMSHAQLVLEVLKEDCPILKEASFALIGVNKMTRTLLQFLSPQARSKVFLANRTFTKAQELAEITGGQAFGLDRLPKVMEQTQILISATSAPHLILHKHHLPSHRPLWIFDLAVPRDVDPSIGNLPGIALWNIEDLESRQKQNLEARQEALVLAGQIIEEEVRAYVQR